MKSFLWMVFYGLFLAAGVYVVIAFLPMVNLTQPTVPANLEELVNFSERDLWKMRQYYDCSSLLEPESLYGDPYDYDSYLPVEQHELKRFCQAVYKQWIKKYRKKLALEAAEAAERFNQRIDNTE